MIGIYLLTNLITHKVYIGQSVDIHRRWQEHKRSSMPNKYAHKSERDQKAPIHLAMRKYGVDNFELKVLEECSKELLDEREKYWIKYYHSNNKKYGYNITDGGQTNIALKGEKHSQAKLTLKEVKKIKQMLKQGYSLKQIQQKYSFISRSTLSMINTGKIWKDEKESYPLSTQEFSQLGELSGNAILNNEIVMQMRKDYVNMSYQDIAKKYTALGYVERTIRSVIYGESWKHLPIYKKKLKKWIKPCIDYPQSLK